MQHIKLPIHFFEDDKLKAVRAQKDGDTVILLYTMLITVAVKSNATVGLCFATVSPTTRKSSPASSI